MEKNQKPKTEGDKQAEEKLRKWMKEIVQGEEKEEENIEQE